MKKQKTLGQIAYDATPDEGGKSNFGSWSGAPEVVRRVHEKMAATIEKVVERRVRKEMTGKMEKEINRRVAEELKEPEDWRNIGLIVGSADLTKACNDVFDFALGLRSGEVFRFTSAYVVNREWVHLVSEGHKQVRLGLGYTFPRGIDVRIADIVWVADAPEGS